MIFRDSRQCPRSYDGTMQLTDCSISPIRSISSFGNPSPKSTPPRRSRQRTSTLLAVSYTTLDRTANSCRSRRSGAVVDWNDGARLARRMQFRVVLNTQAFLGAKRRAWRPLRMPRLPGGRRWRSRRYGGPVAGAVGGAGSPWARELFELAIHRWMDPYGLPENAVVSCDGRGRRTASVGVEV